MKESPECDECYIEEETPLHYVGKCAAFEEERKLIFGKEDLTEEEFYSTPVYKLLQFIRKSQRFGKID
jgi:hypothetical protein